MKLETNKIRKKSKIQLKKIVNRGNIDIKKIKKCALFQSLSRIGLLFMDTVLNSY